jgi:NADH dehydrogenase/NADH:ubiquinone oxidoreductase subunit G
MRILPRVNEAVNEEWISDKTRFIWDGLRSAAARPALCARERQAARGDLGEAFAAIAAKGEGRRGPERIGAIAGDLARASRRCSR